MAKSAPLDVAIIGAGIIGLAAAHCLVASGRRVTLIDRAGVAQGASFANAGALAFSDIMPLASSGILRKLPRWLSDPLGPLSIPPGYLPTILPWLMRFWRAGWPDRVKKSIAAQTALMALARTEMAALVQATGLGSHIRSDGSLELYESEAELAASASGWAQRDKAGIEFSHLRGPALADLQPGLSPRFVAGTFVPSWQTVSDPFQFATAIAAKLDAAFLTGEVKVIRPVAKGVELALASGETILAKDVVIACGAWSKHLAVQLGDNIPLETERGYNTTLPAAAFALKRQLIFGGHGFVVTPLSTGIRIGGAVELGGLTLKPNFARADAMLNKAAAFMPGLKTEGGTQWMGFRPSLPDSLPAIGRSRISPHIVYAFGHGHLGLTQSAATGRLVEELINAKPPSIDLTPFSPQRFRSVSRKSGHHFSGSEARPL